MKPQVNRALLHLRRRLGLFRFRLSSALEERLESLVFNRFSSSAEARSRTALLLTPGGHNTGDQAMYDSVVLNVSNPITVIVPTIGGFDHGLLDSRCDSVVIEAPFLLKGGLLRHMLGLLRTIPAIRQCSQFLVIGADVMDGGYSERSSVRTWRLLSQVHQNGFASGRVLGFSWNGAPQGSVRVAVRKAASVGVECRVRDQISLDRILPLHPGAILSSDVVFANSQLRAQQPLGMLEPGSSPTVVINVSSLVAKALDVVSEYVLVCESLLKSGYRLILVSHVTHPSSDDRPLILELARRLPQDGRVDVLAHAMSPAAVAETVQRAAFAITGRMHLSIICAVQGRPAIVLATQGKVQGLMDLLQVPEFCVVPGPGLAASVLEAVARLSEQPADIQDALGRGVVSARDLARFNFMSDAEVLAIL